MPIEMANVQNIRPDFPILRETKAGNLLVYLDNGATTQKPHAVIDAMRDFYQHDNANVHRGLYALSERATVAYEEARQTVQHFIHAANANEIIFTRGTTDAINLVAASLGRFYFKKDDEIVISTMEHHSNIVPWQMICEQTGARLKVIHVHPDGTLDMTHFKSLLNSRTKLISLIHVSNVLGTINPVKACIAAAHELDIPVLLDGAQAVAHLPVDVVELDCDFYTFSAHKLYGPMGVGVLYGKSKWLEKMPPYQGGGDMIARVTFEKTTYHELPYKFEAGTPNVAGIIGMAAAIYYLQHIGWQYIQNHEQQLLTYALSELKKIPGLKIIGDAKERVAVISFVMADVHPHDIGTVLDSEHIAIRAGHHCAMPLMDHFNVPATARVSFGIYNTLDEIDRLCDGLQQVVTLFN